MPTVLPPPKRQIEKKRSLFGTVLNAFLVVSALMLTFMVLVQEQRFANGLPGPLTAMMQQAAGDAGGESQIAPPAN